MLVGAAVAVVGASFGAIAVSAGMPWYLPAVLSVVVFAGAAQFVFVGIAAAGGSVAAAVVAGLLVNLRHLPFGFAVGDIIGSRWRDKLLGSYLMIDETVAF
jgi:predicted branched-subunit amino acid permease